MKIALPIAGLRRRFRALGGWLPDALAPVRQRPLIAWAIEPLAPEPRDVIVVAPERDRALLDGALDAVLGRETVRVWTGDTPGPLHTLLRAREHLDTRDEVVVIVPRLVWSADLRPLRASEADAGCVVTTSVWHEPLERRREHAYCRLDPDGAVREVVVAPAVPLTWADVGVYWWREGRRLCECAERHLRPDAPREDGSALAAVLNTALRLGLRVRTARAQTYVNLAHPERAARWEGWGDAARGRGIGNDTGQTGAVR